MNKGGVAQFIDGLREMGFNPTALSGKSDHIFFDYAVKIGSHKGKTVRLGFIVPQDFPLTCPTGPHVSPHIHTINPSQGSGHPKGGVHPSPIFENGDVGGQWQYWSRPFTDWAKTKKTVTVYMNHIWRLWETQ